MREELTTEMENRIIKAATEVFVQKGRSGASMKDIADKANINRTLLNYYFRSKDRLFDLIFDRVFSTLMPAVVKILNSDLSLFRKMELFIDSYYEILSKNPLIPVFILHELNAHPVGLLNRIKSHGIRPHDILVLIEEEIEMGNVKNIDPRQILVNLISLIIFPFAARPVFEEILFNNDREAYEKFIRERREELKAYFLESIKT